jgi:hypothetical protein
MLGELDAIAAAYICDDVGAGFEEALNVYGFFRDFDIVIPGPAQSECVIEIEGFI